ncbi:MAG: ATP-binding cassette domain-containing protein [Pseudomonadota bacterium]
MTNPLLQIEQLSVDYLSPGAPAGTPPALSLASLSLDRGQLLAICGPSGCGKTTLGRTLLGMLPASARVQGSCRFDGEELVGLPEKRWLALRGRHITGLSQDPAVALNPVLRIGRQFRQLGLSADRARHILSELELGDERRWLRAYPHELSGGQCQRVALGLALALEPALLLADEPTAALDGRTTREVMALMMKLATQRNMAVLLITHDLPLMEHLGLRLLHLTRPSGTDPADAEASGDSPQPMAEPAAPPPDSADPPRLALDGLTVAFPGAAGGRALDEVSLELAAGSTTAVVGESGSGKSTLARTVMGLLTPAQGTVRLNGQVMGPRWGPERLPMQLVLQDTFASLNPRRRVRQVLAESLAQVGEAAAQAGNLLSDVGLDASFLDRYPHQLSGGQRQRVALARSLAVKPALLVLDEAFSALDIPVRAALLELLRGLQRARGFSMLMITHDTDRLSQVAEHVVLLEAGKVVKAGPVAEVLPLLSPTSVA